MSGVLTEPSFFKLLLLQVVTLSVEPRQESLWKLSSLFGSFWPLPAALNIVQFPSLYLLYCYMIHPQRSLEGPDHQILFPSPGGRGDKLSSSPPQVAVTPSDLFPLSLSFSLTASFWLCGDYPSSAYWPE